MCAARSALGSKGQARWSEPRGRARPHHEPPTEPSRTAGVASVQRSGSHARAFGPRGFRAAFACPIWGAGNGRRRPFPILLAGTRSRTGRPRRVRDVPRTSGVAVIPPHPRGSIRAKASTRVRSLVVMCVRSGGAHRSNLPRMRGDRPGLGHRRLREAAEVKALPPGTRRPPHRPAAPGAGSSPAQAGFAAAPPPARGSMMAPAPAGAHHLPRRPSREVRRDGHPAPRRARFPPQSSIRVRPVLPWGRLPIAERPPVLPVVLALLKPALYGLPGAALLALIDRRQTRRAPPVSARPDPARVDWRDREGPFGIAPGPERGPLRAAR